jgi:uncharacterized protein (TIGR03083 family)
MPHAPVGSHLAVDRLTDECTLVARLARSVDHAEPIAHLGGWTVGEVLAHLTGDFGWACSIVEPRRWDGQLLMSVDETHDELCEAFDLAATRMIATLRSAADDPDARCVNFAHGESGTLAFWPRHQHHETMLHRWDLEVPTGDHHPIDADLALDAIDEALHVYAARYAGHRIDRPVVLSARSERDAAAWRFEPFGRRGRVAVTRVESDDDADIGGGAVDVLLAVWGRIEPGDGRLDVREGDALELFDGPLTA